MLNYLAVSVIPIMIFVIIIIGIKEKKDVYALFIEGVIEGIKIVYKIFPYVLGITVAIGLLKNTNALNIILTPIIPILNNLGVPMDIIPLMAFRPLSGAASTSLVMDIFKNCGPDSTSGKIASVIMGGTETTIYTITILFAAAKVKNLRGTLIAGLLADVTAIITAIILVNIAVI
ncbi:MAG: spore maturation protein [Clostridia bacterium]|nr:spore maturation protein [Clostridia bacterium]MDD4386963.1 spore maturation protein [Clostridia bacterium]